MGKRIENLRKSLDPDKKYSLKEAVALVKKTSNAKFDETLEVHFKLGIDVKQSDQQVRSTVSLPHGTGKPRKVAVIAKGYEQEWRTVTVIRRAFFDS